tara:strand:- start:18 stop:260 length:243 start_codon:yes stop_codon:yes gene_type:complete
VIQFLQDRKNIQIPFGHHFNFFVLGDPFSINYYFSQIKTPVFVENFAIDKNFIFNFGCFKFKHSGQESSLVASKINFVGN